MNRRNVVPRSRSVDEIILSLQEQSPRKLKTLPSGSDDATNEGTPESLGRPRRRRTPLHAARSSPKNPLFYKRRRRKIVSVLSFTCVLFLASFAISYCAVRYWPFPTIPTTITTSTTTTFQLHSKHAPACTPLTHKEQVDFTVVTQTSEDRLWMLQYHCQRWPGPISIAVFTQLPLSQIKDQIHCSNSSRLTLQLVSGYSEEEYPVNVLRNTAVRAVQTSHVVYVDIDFWEATDLYDSLQTHRAFLMSSTKIALLMPAFQMFRQCEEWRDCQERNIPLMAQTRDELIHMLMQGKADPFDPTNPGGHGSTRYRDWLTQASDTLLPLECVLSNRFEPYLVFRYCADLPPFQEVFSGYGKNKMTWMMQLRRMGYTFWQLNTFLLHYPHLDSTARMHWNGGDEGQQLKKPKDPHFDWLSTKRGRVDQTFVEFRKWLRRTIPDETQVPLCENALNDDERLWLDRSALEDDDEDDGE